MATTTLRQPHTLGATEAMHRVTNALQQLEGANANIKSTGFTYDGHTFTLNLLAYGRAAQVVFTFTDTDVSATVHDDAGWLVEHWFVEPRVQKLLAEALK